MIIADLRDSLGSDVWPIGTLGNLRDAVCERSVAGASCVAHEHYATAPGCTRVALARWPLPGEVGSFGYDPATQLPVANAAATRAARLAAVASAAAAKLQAQTVRDAVAATGKVPADVQATLDDASTALVAAAKELAS